MQASRILTYYECNSYLPSLKKEPMSVRPLNYRASAFPCMPLQDNLPCSDGCSMGCPWQYTSWCGCHNQTAKPGAPYNLPCNRATASDMHIVPLVFLRFGTWLLMLK
ncbi:hypothetical protein D3C78_1054130 [compost metagenome]